MSSVEQTSERRGLFRRLDLIYFALAGFDLLTIIVALVLGHLTVTAFEDGVRTSALWSQRQADMINLLRLAQDANEPGNDVFYSRDARAERARFEPALAAFNAEFLRVSQSVRSPTLSPRDDEILADLVGIKQTVDRMAAQTEIILGQFARGDEERASRSMAVMDRTFANLIRQFDEALVIVDAGRAEHLEAQLGRARALRGLELFVALAVLVIVGLVAIYGAYMGRTLRADEAQRAAILKELAAGRERLEHYADDVSHELRGPISKMRLDAELLLQSERSPGQYRAGVESILIESQRLTAIVESLLFLARADNTQVLLQPVELDVDKELGVLAEFFAPAAEEAGVAIEVKPSQAKVWADRSLLQRALSNLIGNALAYTPRGGRIRLSAAQRDQATMIEVADTGPGIAQELLPHVFDRFRRGDKALDGGLGLGLAITRSIAELHGGWIELAEAVPRGLLARLSFPALPAKITTA
jgi:two-component system, OmpR family, heavy metal sensor histidine kinase CusS